LSHQTKEIVTKKVAEQPPKKVIYNVNIFGIDKSVTTETEMTAFLYGSIKVQMTNCVRNNFTLVQKLIKS
jgi:hypothetical protein